MYVEGQCFINVSRLKFGVCVCVCGIRYKCLLILINFVTSVKELHLNPTCNDKFRWMVLIKKSLIMTC